MWSCNIGVVCEVSYHLWVKGRDKCQICGLSWFEYAHLGKDNPGGRNEQDKHNADAICHT
jgi:hypothetical protein